MRILWLALVAVGATAQQPDQVLTLADCWKLAEGQFSLVERARQEERAAAEQVRQARAGFLPQAVYQNVFVYNTPRRSDRTTFSFVSLDGIRHYITQPTVTQEIDVSGRLRASLERGRAEVSAAQGRTAITRRDLRLAVREAYYATLEARHNAEAAERAVEEAEAFVRRTRLMAEQGEAARADLVKAEAQLAARRRELYTAQTGALNAGLALKSFWTGDLAQAPVLEDTFFQVPDQQDYLGWEAAWVARRPEFSLLEAAARAARADARAARSERRPAFDIVYAYGLDANQVRIGERGQAVFATLRIPIFDWHRSRSRERQAEYARRQIEIDRQIARRLFASAFYSERNNTDLSVKQMAEGRREVELARESLRLARLRYDGGEGSALEVVDAMNTLVAAEISYHRAVFQYHASRARLEVAAGQ
jgi:outer membrane protein TolC